MKKQVALLALTFMAIGFFACKKSTTQPTTNNNNNTPTSPTASMTASYAGVISGNTYSVTNVAFTHNLSDYSQSNGLNSFSGTFINTSGSETVTIGIHTTFTTTGVYSLNALGAGQINGTEGSSSFFDETGYGTPTGVGTLTVTTYDTTTHLMSGTFSFTAGNTSSSSMLSVTNGAFSNLKF